MAVQQTIQRTTAESWTLLDLLDQAPGLHALSDTLVEITEEGAPVVALTGDLKYSNGLVRYSERFPERFFNMGISEQNMVSVAAGMATTGLTPFVADFASFLPLLCCEQIRTDVAYSQLPVRLIGHHAGITLGFYGTSHHATEDLSITRAIANLTVVCPTDAAMLSASIRASVGWEQPIYYRIGRGREPDVYTAEELRDFEFGRAIWHHWGSEAVVIATGSMVSPALRGGREAAQRGSRRRPPRHAHDQADRPPGDPDGRRGRRPDRHRRGAQHRRWARRGGRRSPRRQGLALAPASPRHPRRLQPDRPADPPLPALPAGGRRDRAGHPRGAGAGLMRPKVTSVAEAIGLCSSGDEIALGGATMRRKPMGLVRALAASEATDLTLWTWIGSLDVDLLVGAGKVRTINSAYVGFGAFGLAQTSRRAFADGSVEFRDWSESSLAEALRAGSAGLPAILTKALLGTSLADGLAEEVSLPFTDERLMAAPSARPDVALIHAQCADELGNVQRRRPNRTDDIDHLIATSARRLIVSVEEIVTKEEVLADRDATIIPGTYVDAVVHLPGGAHPTGCDGHYNPDLAHLAAYAEASRSPEGIADYVATFVDDVGPDRYRELTAAEVSS